VQNIFYNYLTKRILVPIFEIETKGISVLCASGDVCFR